MQGNSNNNSSSANYRNGAEVPPRHVSDNRWRSDDDEDETLYELSESSDKTSVPRAVSSTSHSQGSTASRPLTSEASAALLAHKQSEQGVLPHAREPLRRGSGSATDIRQSTDSGDEPVSPGYSTTQSRQTSIQQTAIENAAISLANAAHQTLPSRRISSTDGAATTPAHPVAKTTPPDFPDRDIKQFRHDSDGGPPLAGLSAVAPGVVDRGIDPPLDLTASLLALTPSYLLRHAEVKVSVNGILVGRDLTLAAPPYVRASLLPARAHSIARTGPLRGPILTNATIQANGRTREGRPLTTPPPPAENAVEYLPREEDAGRHVSLSLGSGDIPLVSEGAGFLPVLRLEIVWGRSLGRCDLSLMEALRHPGSTFKQIKAPICPIWKEEPKGQPTSVNRNSIDASPVGLFGAQKNEASFDGSRRFTTGQVHFDVGVRLTGSTGGSPPEDGTSTEATTSFVMVEAIDLRVAGARGRGGSGVAQRDGIIGVRAELALGDDTRLATIDPRLLHLNGKDSDPISAAPADSQNCSAVLKSTCSEIDTLVLRLERRPRMSPQQGKSNTSPDVEHRDGERGKGHGLTIPVSDINDCFCHRAQWVSIDCFREEHGPTRTAGNQTTNVSGKLGSNSHHPLEVQLRLTVTQDNPANQYALGGGAFEDGQLVEGTVPRPGTCRFTGSALEQNSSFGAINSDASWSAFEAWVLSPRNGRVQSRAVVSSIGSKESPPRAGKTFRTLNGVVGGGDSPGQGPGVLQLEVLAMHGQATDPAETDNGGQVSEMPLWWVRVTILDGGGGSVTVDSSVGEVEGGGWQEGQHVTGNGARVHGGGVVRWATDKRARARCLVHWTLKKRVLPTASLTIFRGKVWFLSRTCVLHKPSGTRSYW